MWFHSLSSTVWAAIVLDIVWVPHSEGTNPGFGLEGFESFRLFQKGFASPSPKNFGLESGFGFESFESFRLF